MISYSVFNEYRLRNAQLQRFLSTLPFCGKRFKNIIYQGLQGTRSAMSRLGDLLRQERLRRQLTSKQAAKLAGVSEAFLVGVEQGKKIIADTEARRILKKLGVQQPKEDYFSLEDVAATVDLKTIVPKKEPAPMQLSAKGYTRQGEDSSVSGSLWLDALSAVLKKVPVYNGIYQQIDSRLLPVQQEKVEGYAPDKVFYFEVADDDMRGFRLLRGDRVFLVKESLPQDGALMLVQVREHYMIRKIKKLDAANLMLQSFGREYEGISMPVDKVKCIGLCLRLEAKLS